VDPIKVDSHQSLGAYWRQLARRATDTQLALCAAAFPVALAMSVAISIARPHWAMRWWPSVAAPFLVGSFGLWGIGDRELALARRAAWRVVQGAAVVVAIFSAAVLSLWFLQHAIGTWTL
jgi:hypothetical protein